MRAIRMLMSCVLAAGLLSCASPPEPPMVTVESRYSLLESFGAAEVELSPVDRTELKVIRTDEDERPGIVTHAPSRIRYRAVPIHPGARLRIEYGLAGISDCEGFDGVIFSVVVDDAQGSETRVWESRMASAGLPWRQETIDLGDHEGGVADLILQTEPLSGTRCGPAAWGRSWVRSEGRDVALAEHPIVRQVHVRNLLDRMRPRLVAEDAERSLQYRIELPASPVLEVGGNLMRGKTDDESLGPVRFLVEQDGRIVLDHTLESERFGGSFFQSISLEGTEGEASDLSFRIETEDEKARALWTWISIARHETVPRLASSSGRNLLVLLVDTLRADHLGLYGHDRPTSPNLDRFASEALVFERAIAQSSWTHPATASILTGLYPVTHGVLGGERLDPVFDSLPKILQRAGFTTFGLSANPILGQGSGFHRGFETFVHPRWARADAVNDLFRRWLEEQDGVRWFAYLHYIDPHGPYNAPGPFNEEFTRGYESRYSDEEAWRRVATRVNFSGRDNPLAPGDLEYFARAYDGEILFWDHHFDNLLFTLGSRGVLDDTIVVVVSDHGEEFLEHGKLQHGPHLYDESIHVPLLIRAPGLIEPGRESSQVETRGLMRALLELLDVPSGEASWKDLPSIFDDEPGPAFSHTIEHLRPGEREKRDLLSVRESGWKLILRPLDGSVELYDLEADPGETTDVAAGHAERAAALREQLEDYLRSAVAPGSTQPLDPEMLERLRALGYVE